MNETGGALSAKWAGGSVSIEKSFRTERYAVGFERETPAGNTASVLYLDLEKENVPCYAVSLSLPAMLLQPGERATYVLYLTWTNAVELKGVGKAMAGVSRRGRILQRFRLRRIPLLRPRRDMRRVRRAAGRNDLCARQSGVRRGNRLRASGAAERGGLRVRAPHRDCGCGQDDRKVRERRQSRLYAAPRAGTPIPRKATRSAFPSKRATPRASTCSLSRQTRAPEVSA